MGHLALSLHAVAREPRRIDVLVGQPEGDKNAQERVRAFQATLTKLGMVEGSTLISAYRWRSDPWNADDQVNALIRTRPDVLMVNGTPGLAALQRATKEVPIVFAQVSDPIDGGVVKNLSRPEGNITGFTDYEYSFSVKWLELLKEIAPDIGRVAIIFDPNIKALQKFIPFIEDELSDHPTTSGQRPGFSFPQLVDQHSRI